MGFRILYGIALFFLMLVTGVFWGTWFTLTRTIEDFSAAEFIHIGQVIISNVAIPMSIIMPLSILLIILVLWKHPQKKGKSFYYTLTHGTLTPEH